MKNLVIVLFSLFFIIICWGAFYYRYKYYQVVDAPLLKDTVIVKDTVKIKIPMTGKTESLNAAVATGIILYEKQRQEIMK